MERSTTISARTSSIGSFRSPVCVPPSALGWGLAHELCIASIDAIERPFSPDGAKDLGSSWRRQAAGQVLTGSRRLAKPNALMFFHIPL